MDKAYKEDIPKYKRVLEGLKREFARLESSTDGTALRIAPLLERVERLERVMKSAQFSKENARLRRGVGMFHADLVYLRVNLKVLKEILARETPGRKDGMWVGRILWMSRAGKRLTA